MDFSNRFSLVDFLAYLFPGIVASLGLGVLLLLTPLKDAITLIPADLATGILFLTVSYLVGVILSGFSEITTKWRRGGKGLDVMQTSILVPGFQEDVRRAFRAMFKPHYEGEIEWSRTHFYLCRSLVYERMPNAALVIQRQSALRQLRMNLIFPMLIWFGAGLGWGIWCFYNNLLVWGIVLIALSIALVILTLSMIINRMNSNEYREVREVLAAFLAGYTTGMFDRPDRGG